MSPILVRPVREQLEHDRVIRLLQVKYKRKFEVAVNLGTSHVAPVGPPLSPWYPDLVLQSLEKSRKLLGVVEVETAESVNNLEAMSQWAAFGRLKTAFHLYVPSGSIDPARRLCADLQIPVAELWAYSAFGIGDQVRFTLVHRSAQAEAKADAATPSPVASAKKPAAAAKAARKAPVKAVAKPAKPAARSAAKPASKPAAKGSARAAAKPVRKAAVKAPAKAARPAAKSSGKPAARPVAKGSAKAAAKPARAKASASRGKRK